MKIETGEKSVKRTFSQLERGAAFVLTEEQHRGVCLKRYLSEKGVNAFALLDGCGFYADDKAQVEDRYFKVVETQAEEGD